MRMTIDIWHPCFWFGIYDLAKNAVKYPSKESGKRIRQAILETPTRGGARAKLVKIFRQVIAENKQEKEKYKALGLERYL